VQRTTRTTKNRFNHAVAIAVLDLILATAAFAHHSQSEFDPSLPVNVKGTVSKVEWKSPHARLYVDVRQEDGEIVNWNFELPSPNTLMRRGWKRDALQPGDEVTVSGYRARNFPTIGIGKVVTGKDGKAIFAGSADEGSGVRPPTPDR
jgi:Family of unknown function (DUF6152)